MRIEIEHTPGDWRQYIAFYMERAKGPANFFWLVVLVTAVVAGVTVYLIERLAAGTIHLVSVLIGMVVIYGSMFIASRTRRVNKTIPESWLGRHVYEFLPDGLHTSSTRGTAIIPWQVLGEVRETPDNLFIGLDNITALMLPKRHLESHGGAAAVRAEIARLRAEAASQQFADATNRIPGAGDTLPASGSTGMPPPPLALPRNLLAGLRLATFLPVRATDFHPTARQCVLLLAIALALWLAITRLQMDVGEVAIAWYVVAQVGWLAGIAALVLILLAPRRNDADTLVRLFTAVASTTPTLVAVSLLVSIAPVPGSWSRLVPLALVVYIGAVMYRAQRAAIGEIPGFAAARTFLGVVLVWYVYSTTAWQLGVPWYSTDESAAEAAEERFGGIETTLFAQPDIVDAAVGRLQPGTKGTTEAYFVGFAGFGEQGVFDREIRFANDALGRHLDFSGRSLSLVNTPEQRDGATPLATASGLARALSGLAGKMNVDEDVLVLFLTSHGSEDAQLSVNQGFLPLEQLDGETLRTALDQAGIQWRVIVISACHAGSFIPYLSDERTLIVAAAHADKTSFGCSDERDLTYFGEAFLQDALPTSTDLLDAFARARKIVSERERSEGLEASDPQLYVGEQVKAKLSELGWRRLDAKTASP